MPSISNRSEGCTDFMSMSWAAFNDYGNAINRQSYNALPQSALTGYPMGYWVWGVANPSKPISSAISTPSASPVASEPLKAENNPQTPPSKKKIRPHNANSPYINIGPGGVIGLLSGIGLAGALFAYYFKNAPKALMSQMYQARLKIGSWNVIDFTNRLSTVFAVYIPQTILQSFPVPHGIFENVGRNITNLFATVQVTNAIRNPSGIPSFINKVLLQPKNLHFKPAVAPKDFLGALFGAMKYVGDQIYQRIIIPLQPDYNYVELFKKVGLNDNNGWLKLVGFDESQFIRNALHRQGIEINNKQFDTQLAKVFESVIAHCVKVADKNKDMVSHHLDPIHQLVLALEDLKSNPDLLKETSGLTGYLSQKFPKLNTVDGIADKLRAINLSGFKANSYDLTHMNTLTDLVHSLSNDTISKKHFWNEMTHVEMKALMMRTKELEDKPGADKQLIKNVSDFINRSNIGRNLNSASSVLLNALLIGIFMQKAILAIFRPLDKYYGFVLNKPEKHLPDSSTLVKPSVAKPLTFLTLPTPYYTPYTPVNVTQGAMA
jgi:uncharacterized protein YfkK (UPF0435 family)